MRRLALNVLLAYALAAVVTFCLVLASELISPSDVNPYIGQAAGGTAWTIGWLSFGSPAVLFVLGGLDWGLRHMRDMRQQRLVGAAISLLPAVFWIVVVALTDTDALVLAAWFALVGLAFGRLMLLPLSPGVL